MAKVREGERAHAQIIFDQAEAAAQCALCGVVLTRSLSASLLNGL